MDNKINQESDINRIKTAKNRVFTSALGIGKNNPIALHTNDSSIYRVTGMGQIADIINCGFVRPKEGKIKGGHENEVFWSLGGKLYFYDKRPVLETKVDKVQEGQIGALPITDLSAIWIFDEIQNKYDNRIDIINNIRDEISKSGMQISAEEIETLLKQNLEQKREQDTVIEWEEVPQQPQISPQTQELTDQAQAVLNQQSQMEQTINNSGRAR